LAFFHPPPLPFFFFFSLFPPFFSWGLCGRKKQSGPATRTGRYLSPFSFFLFFSFFFRGGFLRVQGQWCPQTFFFFLFFFFFFFSPFFDVVVYFQIWSAGAIEFLFSPLFFIFPFSSSSSPPFFFPIQQCES